MISFFNGLKTYGKKNQLKNLNALVIFLSILRRKKMFSYTCFLLMNKSNISLSLPLNKEPNTTLSNLKTTKNKFTSLFLFFYCSNHQIQNH